MLYMYKYLYILFYSIYEYIAFETAFNFKNLELFFTFHFFLLCKIPVFFFLQIQAFPFHYYISFIPFLFTLVRIRQLRFGAVGAQALRIRRLGANQVSFVWNVHFYEIKILLAKAVFVLHAFLT